MQIQSIERNKVNFQSRNNNLEKASAFVNMDDSAIQEVAYQISYDKKNSKKQKNTMLKMFFAIPIVDTLASGILVGKSPLGKNFIAKTNLDSETATDILRNASLKNRIKAAGSTAKGWALVLGLIGAYSVVKNAVVSQSDSAQNFERKNPLGSFLLDLGILIAGVFAGSKGISKLKEKFPNAGKEINTKADKMLNKLNKTKFNKSILPTLSEGAAQFAEKMPGLAKATRFTIANSMWIILIGGLAKLGLRTNRNKQRAERTYVELKKAQVETAKHLTNALQVERDILAQDQPQLAKDLHREIEKTKPVE